MKRQQRQAGQRTVTHPTTEAVVRIGGSFAIPAVLRGLGADPAEVFAKFGFDPKLFDDPDNRVSFATRNRLMGYCAATTRCPHFGLLVGQHGGLHSLGLVGSLMKYSPNVETALRGLVRYMPLHVRGAVTTLAVDDGLAVLAYEIYQTQAAATEQVGDGAVAVLLNIMREFCGREWKPIEARFAHRRPKDIGPFRRFFGTPLRFDAEQYALVFSEAWLNHRLPEIDAALRRLLQHEIAMLEARHGADFPEQVRSVLRSALVTGHSKADQVAALFSMRSYTLARRLQEFGVGFQTLVDEIRFEIARQMLESSAMEVREVAELLEYANASAFTRAFRRWSGTTPAQWRATHGGAS
jgi:AraC-like DNA-binding protein